VKKTAPTVIITRANGDYRVASKGGSNMAYLCQRGVHKLFGVLLKDNKEGAFRIRFTKVKASR
jgi:hypothetical protein